ncbi:hypothetical protein CU086_00770 [Candidatus Nasuia deltocephalinicola]|uniref:Uncharacterized protein n=1 Tax=Candidatus Nasuia deltocephalincola TaxID=1160784 RepID=A0A974WKQ9_9PROT|nr:hypothetical protein CU086_00770 [Candidatus Nasuia deltocephalinicola]
MIKINEVIKEYNIIEKINAGIVLEGWEVKNIKFYKNIELKNSYIINIKNEIFLKNSKINSKNISNLKIQRNRKLLLKKKK